MRVVAQQNDADFVCVHVERNAEHVARKYHQFIETHAGETRYLGDAGFDTGDSAHFPWRQYRRERLSHLADSSKRVVEIASEALWFHGHRPFVTA